MRINPISIETVGITGGNTQDGWKYLTSQTTQRPTAQSLREGVRIKNVGPSAGNTDAVLSVQGISLGSFTAATGGVGFALSGQAELFLPVSDLSTVIVKTNNATASVGITLAYVAY